MLLHVEEITINGNVVGHSLGYADEREVADVLVNLWANRHRGETWETKCDGIAAMLTSQGRMDVGSMLETLVDAIEGAEMRHRAASATERIIADVHQIVTEENAQKAIDEWTSNRTAWRAAIGCAPANPGSISPEEAIRRGREP